MWSNAFIFYQTGDCFFTRSTSYSHSIMTKFSKFSVDSHQMILNLMYLFNYIWLYKMSNNFSCFLSILLNLKPFLLNRILYSESLHCHVKETPSLFQSAIGLMDKSPVHRASLSLSLSMHSLTTLDCFALSVTTNLCLDLMHITVHKCKLPPSVGHTRETKPMLLSISFLYG